MERLKNKKRIVGLRQTLKSLRSGKLEIAYIAMDADPRVVGGFEQECISMNVEIRRPESMKELGKECGIEVGTAVAGIEKE
ncbi:MAG: ribosomal L7Ae/L30e/S12e/Gadd45 family protein [Clostridia bacterium]